MKSSRIGKRLLSILFAVFIVLVGIFSWLFVRSQMPLDEFLLALVSLSACFAGFILGIKSGLVFALLAVFAVGTLSVVQGLQAGSSEFYRLFWLIVIPLLAVLGGLASDGVRRMRERLDMLDGRLEDLVAVDEFTGLEKSRRFALRVVEELARTKRYGGVFTLVVVQLAFMKELDDVHGPRVRNLVIRKLAETLGRIVRTEDFIARLGEGEFGLLLPQTPIEGARTLADRLRERTLYVDVSPSGEDFRRVRLTVRVGVAVYPEDGDDYIPLLETARADCEYNRS